MSGGLTEVYGMRVNGALSPVGRATSGIADLVIDSGPITDPIKDAMVGEVEVNGQAVTIRQSGNAAFARFHGLADAMVDLVPGTATIEMSPGSPPGMDEVLAAGPVMALALALAGQPCLHASAVSRGGRAVAFAGPSGGGKSTLAALACLAGAELVADDILALALDGSEVRCLPGSRELRLRAATAELLTGAKWSRRTTADERVAVLVGREDLPAPRLAAIVLPVITVDGTEGTERLRGAKASAALLACSRVVALKTGGHVEAMLNLTTALVGSVPVYEVKIARLTQAELPEPVRAVLEAHLGPSE